MQPRPPSWKPGRAGRSALIACLVLVLCGASPRAEEDPVELAVKATYLYKFAPFIEWPEGAFASESAPLILCIVGEDPFGGLLDRAVRGQGAGEHPIELRRLPVAGHDTACHIMYVAGSPARPVSETLHRLRGAPVLTITDSARDPAAKGIIHFVVTGDRVRFEVDDRAAAESGIAISSKVLSLAVSVRPRPRE